MENSKILKFKQDLETMYDWATIIQNERKNKLKSPNPKTPSNETKHDMRQFFNLMKIPCTQTELNILCSTIQLDPKKPLISKEELIKLFAPDEQLKRKHNRQLKEAIMFLAEGKDKMSHQTVRDLIKNYSQHPEIIDILLAQLASCQSNGHYNVQKLLELLCD